MSILSSLLGLGKGQPVQQIPQTVQTQEIAQEVAPFIKDMLGKGQALYEQRMEEGFVPFEGQTLADVTADQLAAQQGLRSLVGTQAGGLQEARELVRAQTQQATTEALQPFMNPYQQAVTDIAKREAQERFEQETLPGLRKQAIDAGAFGGSRAAMRESQAQDAQARLLADIQAKGSLAAFQDARKAFEAQKTRERQAAEGLTGLTGQEFGARRAELAGLEAIGREEQQRQQQLLDESYQRFLQERGFPEQQLGQYQGIVQGASPLIGTSQITRAPQTFQPSPVAQALGTAAQVADIYGTFKGAGAPRFSLFSEGGQIVPAKEGTEGGLSVIIKMIRAQKGKGGDPRSKRSEDIRTRIQQEDVTDMLDAFEEGGLPVIERQKNDLVLSESEKRQLARKGRFTKDGITYTSSDFETGQKRFKDSRDEKIEQLEKTLKMLSQQNQERDVSPVVKPKIQQVTADESELAESTKLVKDELGTALKDVGVKSEAEKKLDELKLASLEAAKGEAEQRKLSALLRGASRGLLATKEGRGGLVADIQAGLGGAQEELAKTEGDAAKIREAEMKVFADNVTKEAADKQKRLDLLLATNQITRQEYQDETARIKAATESALFGQQVFTSQISNFNEVLESIRAGAFADDKDAGLELIRSTPLISMRQRTQLEKELLDTLNKSSKQSSNMQDIDSTTYKRKNRE